MESRHKKLGWCSLKVGIKGGKASPPQSILHPKSILQENVFEDGNLKGYFSNLDVKL
jgi:hypothetical protein